MRNFTVIFIMALLVMSCATISYERKVAEVLKHKESVVVIVTTRMKVKCISQGNCRMTTPSYIGTGFAIDEKHIMTSYHVLRGAVLIEVKDSKGNNIYARVVYADPKRDIAIIEHTGIEKLKPLKLSTDYDQGDRVVLIGHAHGFKYTSSYGHISGVRYFGEQLGLIDTEVVQTDSENEPGKSGGPILNMKGEVVGMITMYYHHPGFNFSVSSMELQKAIAKFYKSIK